MVFSDYPRLLTKTLSVQLDRTSIPPISQNLFLMSNTDVVLQKASLLSFLLLCVWSLCVLQEGVSKYALKKTCSEEEEEENEDTPSLPFSALFLQRSMRRENFKPKVDRSFL